MSTISKVIFITILDTLKTHLFDESKDDSWVNEFYDDLEEDYEITKTSFSDIDIFSGFIRGLLTSLNIAVKNNLDVNSLRENISHIMESIIITKETQYMDDEGIENIGLDLLINWWRKEKNKIHELAYRNSTWTPQFNDMNWRIDVKTSSRHSRELNEPSAFFEITTNKNNENNNIKKIKSCDNNPSLVRFEMNREELSTWLRQVESIENQMKQST